LGECKAFSESMFPFPEQDGCTANSPRCTLPRPAAAKRWPFSSRASRGPRSGRGSRNESPAERSCRRASWQRASALVRATWTSWRHTRRTTASGWSTGHWPISASARGNGRERSPGWDGAGDEEGRPSECTSPPVHASLAAPFSTIKRFHRGPFLLYIQHGLCINDGSLEEDVRVKM
jgi:hypothetical protein